MSASTLLSEITAALQSAAEPAFQERQQGFSREPILSLGVRTGRMREIGKRFFPNVKGLSLPVFFAVCEELLMQGTVEHRGIAFSWAFHRRKELQPAHFEVLFGWLQRFVDNWAACDQLCCEVFGDFMMRHPAFAQHVNEWAASDNRWLRRAAAVVLIPDLRKQANFFPLLITVATTLLPDRDDLVQKGYGWALKVAMARQPDATMAFILQHKRSMSRTALRYAIEKCSPAQKAEAMKP